MPGVMDEDQMYISSYIIVSHMYQQHFAKSVFPTSPMAISGTTLLSKQQSLFLKNCKVLHCNFVDTLDP